MNKAPDHTRHASAAGVYAREAQNSAVDPRELEARVLLKAAARMQDLQARWGEFSAEELDDVLRQNRQIWMMFVDHAATDPAQERTHQLRSNIASLGAYVFKRTLDILADPKKEKLDILVDINREIAAGLMVRQKGENQAPPDSIPSSLPPDSSA